jgi:ribosomal protein L24
MAMLKIKRDDEVVVIAGKDKGKAWKGLKVVEQPVGLAGVWYSDDQKASEAQP